MMPKLFLNHMYVVAGPAIFKALQTSAFFRKEFANVDQKINGAEGFGQWEGLYVRGKKTYLEIFEKLADHNVGDYAIALGVETPGDLDRIFNIVKDRYPQAQRGQYKQPADQHPLFEFLLFPLIKSSTTTQTISVFIIEYTSLTFQIKQSRGAFAKDDISRRRYNSMLWDPAAYFQDLSEISLFLEPQLVDELSHLFSALQLPVTSNNPSSFRGEDFSLILQRKEAHPLLNAQVRMRLNKPWNSKTIMKFDNAQLALENDIATFLFNPSRNAR